MTGRHAHHIAHAGGAAPARALRRRRPRRPRRPRPWPQATPASSRAVAMMQRTLRTLPTLRLLQQASASRCEVAAAAGAAPAGAAASASAAAASAGASAAAVLTLATTRQPRRRVLALTLTTMRATARCVLGLRRMVHSHAHCGCMRCMRCCLPADALAALAPRRRACLSAVVRAASHVHVTPLLTLGSQASADWEAHPAEGILAHMTDSRGLLVQCAGRDLTGALVGPCACAAACWSAVVQSVPPCLCLSLSLLPSLPLSLCVSRSVRHASLALENTHTLSLPSLAHPLPPACAEYARVDAHKLKQALREGPAPGGPPPPLSAEQLGDYDAFVARFWGAVAACKEKRGGVEEMNLGALMPGARWGAGGAAGALMRCLLACVCTHACVRARAAGTCACARFLVHSAAPSRHTRACARTHMQTRWRRARRSSCATCWASCRSRGSCCTCPRAACRAARPTSCCGCRRCG